MFSLSVFLFCSVESLSPPAQIKAPVINSPNNQVIVYYQFRISMVRVIRVSSERQVYERHNVGLPGLSRLEALI